MKATPQSIYSKLADAAAVDIESYNSEYLQLITEIFSLTTSPHQVKSSIRGRSLLDVEDKIRFSLVFNDLTLVDVKSRSALNITLLQPEWFEARFGVPASLSIPEDKLADLGIDPQNPRVSPIFVFAAGEEGNEMAHTLEPLVRAGRLLLQPSRAILVPSATEANNWNTHDVSQFSSLENWQIPSEAPSPPTPITSQPASSPESKLFEVSIPYLTGTTFEDFSKILLDEQDLLSSLRSALKGAIAAAPNESNIAEMVRDTVDPRIDMINRKFRSITSSHAFQVAGTAIGTVVLAYTAASTSGLAAALATVAGSGGLGMLGKEYAEYKKQLREVGDDPFFFLWRVKKSGRQT